MPKTARGIFRESGARGFYAGVASPLVSLVILHTMSFATFDFFSGSMGLGGRAGREAACAGRFEPRVMLAGGCTGLVASVVSTPFELLKIQLQLQQRSSGYKGLRDAAARLAMERGVFVSGGLYTGHAVNSCREFAFCATYFGVYEHSRAWFNQSLPAGVAVPVAGGCAGAFAWGVSYPVR